MDLFPRRLSDGGEDSGGQGQYGYRGGMGGGAQRGAAGLLGGAGSTVVGRVLRGEGFDSAVCGDAAGNGYTAEEQLTGEAEHGGLQIAVYPMKRSIYEKLPLDKNMSRVEYYVLREEPRMGLAPGGLMRQEIYEDEYGIDAWDTSAGSRCFVHIVNSVQLLHLTGCQPPSKPPTAQDYTNAKLPWYDYYGGDLKALEGAKKLAELDSVASVKLKKGEGFLPDNDPVTPAMVKKLNRTMVRESVF